MSDVGKEQASMYQHHSLYEIRDSTAEWGHKLCRSEIRDRFANWPLFKPIMLVNFGVLRQFPDEPAFNLIWLKEPLSVGGQEVEAFMLRIFNYDSTLAPPGGRALQVMFEAGYDYWHNLRQDHDRYEAEKSKFAVEILSRLEARYPAWLRR